MLKQVSKSGSQLQKCFLACTDTKLEEFYATINFDFNYIYRDFNVDLQNLVNKVFLVDGL